jgi:hypothetical protein
MELLIAALAVWVVVVPLVVVVALWVLSRRAARRAVGGQLLDARARFSARRDSPRVDTHPGRPVRL